MNKSHSNQILNQQCFHFGNHFIMSSHKSSILHLLRQTLYAQYLH